MRIQIVIEELDPPRGHGVVDGRYAWAFAGWIELIERVESLKRERPGPRTNEESVSSLKRGR
jgi:hypothetical protein